MLSLRDPTVRAGIDRPKLRFLIELRFTQLAEATAGYESDGDDADSVDLLDAYLVEPGDGFAEIQSVSGLDLKSGIQPGSRLGDAGFMPSLDLLKHHADSECFELVAVTGGEAAVSLFVPDESGMDADVLEFCRVYAEEAAPLALVA